MSRKRDHKKAKGGRAGERETEVGEVPIRNLPYNARGSETEKEATDEKDGFKHGGGAKAKAKKRKRGGGADGKKPGRRADKPRRATGGRAPHSPLTAAAEVQGRPGGHYDAKPSSREDD